MALHRNFARGVAAAALGVAMTVGMALPAAAAPTTSNLQIEKYRLDNSGRYEVIVNMHVSMSAATAQAYVNGGARGELRLYGEDPAEDNLRLGPYAPSSLFADQFGLTLVSRRVVNPSVLNEDSSWWEPAGDELYVNLKILAGNGAVIATSRTNRVDGRY